MSAQAGLDARLAGYEAQRDAHRRSAAFRAARRHTAHVRWLKAGIVASALGSIGFGVAMTLFDPFRAAPASVSLDSIGVSGSRVTMAAPKMSGFRSDSRPYQVTAREAVQDIRQPSLVELRDLSARVAMGANGVGDVTARIGHYDSAKETMRLDENVLMRTDQGHELRMSTAAIDFRSGAMVSDQPVEADLRGSRVTADRLAVSDGGRVLVFEGRVRSRIIGALQPGEGARKQ